MLRLRISVPSDLSDQVVQALTEEPAVSALARMRGASVEPVGDVVTADVAREATDGVVERLLGLGLHRVGTLQVETVETWMCALGARPRSSRPVPRPTRSCGRR